MAPTWSQVMEYALDKAGALPDLTALTRPRWLLALGTCQEENERLKRQLAALRQDSTTPSKPPFSAGITIRFQAWGILT